MARLPRISPVNVPVHIIQRGNNRQVCFVAEEDYGRYAGWLKEYAKKYRVEVHAWVLMSNHVHLLCTPHPEYLALGADPEERRRSYRALLSAHIDKELLAVIRANTKNGLTFGNDRFMEQIEALTGVRVQARKRGRPLGWRKEGK